MKVNIFNVTYYRREISSIAEDTGEKTYGPPYGEQVVSVGALDDAEATRLALQNAQRSGSDVFVSHIGNGTQDVLIPESVAVDESSELTSLKESLAAQIDENAKLTADNAALVDKLAAVQADIAKLRPA